MVRRFFALLFCALLVSSIAVPVFAVDDFVAIDNITATAGDEMQTYAAAAASTSSAGSATLREYNLTFLGVDLTGDGVLNNTVNSNGEYEMIHGTNIKSSEFTWFGLEFEGISAIGKCRISVSYHVTGPSSDTAGFTLYGANKVDGVRTFTNLGAVLNRGQSTTSGGYTGSLAIDVDLDTRYTRLIFYKQFDTPQRLTLGVANSSYSGDVSLSGSSTGTWDNKKGGLPSTVFTLPEINVTGTMSTYNSSNPLLQYYDQYGTVYWKTAGMQFGTLQFRIPKYATTLSISGNSSSTSTFSGTNSLTAKSSYQYGVSFSASGIVTADDGLLPVVKHIDQTLDGVADDVQHIDKTLDTVNTTTKHMDQTLDKVSDNMQKVIDDMETENNAANDIAGTTNNTQINNRDKTLADGITSLDTLSESANISSYKSDASGYIGLLTAVVPTFLNFGGNNLLTTVLVVMIIFSVFIFILRRLL